MSFTTVIRPRARSAQASNAPPPATRRPSGARPILHLKLATPPQADGEA